jgi:predicted RND superfamily exporter protein
VIGRFLAGVDRTFARALDSRVRIAVLALFGVITAVAAVGATRVGIEHDNESLNADDATATEVYERFKSDFGNDEDLLVALRHPRLMSSEGLSLVDSLTRRIAALDGVRRVWSLTTAEQVVRGPHGAEPRPLVAQPFARDGVAEALERALARNVELASWLVSPDRRTAGFLVEIDDRPDDREYRSVIIESVRAFGTEISRGDASLHVTGVPVQKFDVSTAVDRDQRTLLPLAVLAMGAMLWVFFRSFDGVLVPLGVAGATVLWTMGLFGFSGHSLNAITSLLPAVLLVVSVAATVHVYDAWREGQGLAGESGAPRVAHAVRRVAIPVVLCAVTTAQGFASLAINEVPAVRQFGLFAAVGVIVGLAIGMSVVPAVLVALRPNQRARAGEHGWTLRILEHASAVAIARPGRVVSAFGIVSLSAALGLPLVRVNTDLVGFLRSDTALRIDTETIDRDLGGALVVDFVMRRQDGETTMTPEALARLAELEIAIRARPGVRSVSSATAVLTAVYRAETGSEQPPWAGDAAGVTSCVDLLEESRHALWRRFVAPDHGGLRVNVRLSMMGSAQSRPLIDSILRDAEPLLGPGYSFDATGALYHVIHDSERLVTAQVRSFALAIVLVVLTIGALFRSLPWTLLALVPNVMPILWTGGLMGWTGIELSTGTAMIASAVLGLVVDDTIHYLATYRRLYRGDAPAAVRETARIVGAPVTIASASLVVGFWIGALGSFQPTIYFSLLTGMTMITGALCDVLLLPALLVLFASRKTGQSPFSQM